MPTKYLIGQHITHYPKQFVVSYCALTVDPHSYFQKSMRKNWRMMEEHYPDGEWRDTRGRMYVIWKLPDAPSWNVPDAIEWAKQHMGQAEVYVLPRSAWVSVKLAVHPDNPVVFQ